MTLIDFVNSFGINEPITFDETIHRFKPNGANDKSGWFISFDMGEVQVVVVGDFRTGETQKWVSSKEYNKKQVAAKIRWAKENAEKEKAERQAKAQEKAAWFLSKTVDRLDGFEYLDKKKIKKHNAVFIKTNYEEFLGIPIRDKDGNLTSLQKIYSDGTKRFVAGGKIQGCFFTIEGETDVVYLAEGFATAASIHEATGKACVVAFFAHNLEPVYNEIKQHYGRVILAADNDAFTINPKTGEPMNTGVEVAKTLGVKYGLEYIAPKFEQTETKPTDFNDLMVLEGPEAVKNQILNVENLNIVQGEVEKSASFELINFWTSLGIDVTSFGNPVINETNVLKLLQYDGNFKNNLVFDEFSKQILCRNHENDEFEPLNDKFVFNVLLLLQSKYGFKKLALHMARSVVEMFANLNKIDQYKDWLLSLQWDGKPRIERFFQDVCQTPDSEYTTAISRNFWVSMAARGIVAGSKVDTMVVLEGKQGVKKSSLLNVIGGKWFSENTSEFGHKDFYQNLQGVSLLEIAELDGFSKADTNTIKKVLSAREDKFRPSYGRYSITAKRRCVFVGTTNERNYLKDTTGGRRFWPIKCYEINLELAEKNREQYFAEAVKMFQQGVKWFEVPKIAETIQDNRREVDIVEESIDDWLQEKDGPFTTKELLVGALQLPIDRATNNYSISKKIGKILRARGYSQRPFWIEQFEPSAQKVIKKQIKKWALPNDQLDLSVTLEVTNERESELRRVKNYAPSFE